MDRTRPVTANCQPPLITVMRRPRSDYVSVEAPAPPSSLPQRFFHEVREVSLGNKASVEFDAADIVRIAEDVALSAEFRKLYVTGINSPDHREMVRDVLDRMAHELEKMAKLQAVESSLIEKFGLVPPAAALSVALGTILHGVTNPLLALAAMTVAGLGVIGICVAGLGTRVMKRREVLTDSEARTIRRLAQSLRDPG